MKPKYRPFLFPIIFILLFFLAFLTFFQYIHFYAFITVEIVGALFSIIIGSERIFNAFLNVFYKTIRPKRLLKRYKLSWSKEWSKKKQRRSIFNELKLSSVEDLYGFLENLNQWDSFLKILFSKFRGTNWIHEAFESIRTCSKGLYNARFIDYALISVPPPENLVNKIIRNLESENVYAMRAPTGWGKSRLVLWIALLSYFKKQEVYYIPNLLKIDSENEQKGLLDVMDDSNMVVIIDDMHVEPSEKIPNKFWDDLISAAKKHKNSLLFIQTLIRGREDFLSFPVGDIKILQSDKFTECWSPEWVNRFFLWFQGFKHSSLNNNVIFLNYLWSAKKTTNPWAFVSVLVDLKDLIAKHFQVNKDHEKLILFTIIVSGFVANGEKGLTLEQIYKGMYWLRENRQNDEYKFLKIVLPHNTKNLEMNEKQEFLRNFENIILEWRNPPDKDDRTKIRILPGERYRVGWNSPIKIHHANWWGIGLHDLWIEKYMHIPEFQNSMLAIVLIILHSIENFDSHGFFEFIEEDFRKADFRLIKNCTQLKKISIRFTKLWNLEFLGELKQLEALELFNTRIFDLKPLKKLNKLEYLDLHVTNVKYISTLKNLGNLNYLDLTYTSVKNIIPLTSLKKIQNLYLSTTKINDISPLKSLVDLRILSLDYTSINDISSLESLVHLEYLYLKNTQLSDITPLKNLANLKTLDLTNTRIQDITPLKLLNNLEDLNLDNTQVKDFTPIKFLTNLRSLDLNNTHIQDITPLKLSSNLEELRLNNTQVKDFTPIKFLTNLRSLDLGSTRIQDITSLKLLKNLEILSLANTSVKDLNPLKDLAELQLICVNHTNINDITPLKNLRNLIILDLSNTSVQDISPLKSLNNLEQLTLVNTKVTDISPLEHLKKRLDIHFFNEENINWDEISKYK